jgi:hypothetical protein
MPDDQVRRLTADVQLLQAQVTGVNASVLVFAEDLKTLTGLMVELAEQTKLLGRHVNELAGRLAEEANR